MELILGILEAIAGFIKKYPSWALIILLGIVIGVDRLSIHSLNGKVADQKTTIDGLTKANNDYDTKNKQLNGQIADQNDSIQKLKKKGDDYNQQILAQQKKGDATIAAYNKRLAELLAEKTPTDCPGVMDKLLNDAIKNQVPPL